jgi:uncharacterized protein YjbI with pentapeptide repeats
MQSENPIQLTQVENRLEVTQACLIGSTFTNVNLSNAAFNDVNLSGASIRNANLSGWQVQDVTLSGLQLRDADLRNASIVECLTEGMTIDGILLSDLIACWRDATTKS